MKLSPDFDRRRLREIWVPLCVPVTLFIVALFIRPTMNYASAGSFMALRSMLEGGSFNYVTSPDPTNIANDIASFLTWWSPGEYLVPGVFVWLGTDYGLAILLTTLVATVIGVFGWTQVARSFDISCFVLSLFIFGLVTFRYVTVHFRQYHGGELLLFAVSPWSLYVLRWAVDKPPALCLAISVLSAALLFFAKLTGLIVFAANVAAISLLVVMRQRRLTSSLLAVWIGSAIAALLFLVLWLPWGEVAARVSGWTFTWVAVWFPVAGAAFSGISGFDFLRWLFLHPSAPILSDFFVMSYVVGLLGLLLMGWVWFRLRNTRYRPMAIFLFSIIVPYTAALIALHEVSIVWLEERHLRYAGILFFLLLLVALDQWRASLAKVAAILLVGAFAVYGLASYANGARELIRGRHYDSASGISMRIKWPVMSPAVLEYLRSEMSMHNWQRAIAVVPTPEVALALPRFRIIEAHHAVVGQTWAGRVEKIFVIVQEEMRDNGEADALLRSFVDYEFESWSQILLDGMVVYSQ